MGVGGGAGGGESETHLAFGDRFAGLGGGGGLEGSGEEEGGRWGLKTGGGKGRWYNRVGLARLLPTAFGNHE